MRSRSPPPRAIPEPIASGTERSGIRGPAKRRWKSSLRTGVVHALPCRRARTQNATLVIKRPNVSEFSPLVLQVLLARRRTRQSSARRRGSSGTALLFTPWLRLGRILVTAGGSRHDVRHRDAAPSGKWRSSRSRTAFRHRSPCPTASTASWCSAASSMSTSSASAAYRNHWWPRAARGSTPSSWCRSATRTRAMSSPAARSRLIQGRDTEADVVRRIFARLGVDTTRIVWEDKLAQHLGERPLLL
jgi:hypothetical protein